jgi:hypothetical protein
MNNIHPDFSNHRKLDDVARELGDCGRNKGQFTAQKPYFGGNAASLMSGYNDVTI